MTFDVRLYEGKKQERKEIVPPKSVEAQGKLITTLGNHEIRSLKSVGGI